MKALENERGRLKLILNGVVILFSLYGISKQNYVSKESSPFESLMIDFFGPIQRSVTFLKRETGSFLDHYLLNIKASQENQALRNQIDELHGKIFQKQEIFKENKRLKGLLGLSMKIKSKKVLAQVVAGDASSDYKMIRVNKGLSDGIKLQAPVLTAKGLVGYVYRLTDNFSDILTLLDVNNRVDGIIGRIRTHGIVEGFSGDRCLVKYINRIETVILNDLVMTSGLGNIYPKGILIGHISKIERENYGITQYMELTPAVDFGKLEEVMIIISDEAEKIKKEWEALDSSEGKK